ESQSYRQIIEEVRMSCALSQLQTPTQRRCSHSKTAGYLLGCP
ncbi:AraC family transcriptional regulator, partial [Salmonella enterica]|nr:AraC family transcriptional regulator [Salmonella enterica]